MKKSRITGYGMSLIEMLVVLVILILLSGSLAWMLMSGKTIWQASLTASADRQNIQLAAQRISQELRDSQIGLITNNTGGTSKAFSFLSAYNDKGVFITDNAGLPVWQKYVIYYIPVGENRLLRKAVYGSFTAPLTIPQLAAYCDGQGSLVASGVTAFSLNPNLGGNAVSLSLTLQNRNRHGKADQQSLSVTIFLRN